MPPKNKGGKKKGGKGDDDGEISQDLLYEILRSKVEALKSRIVLEQERRDTAQQKIDEIRYDGEAMEGDMDDAKGKTKDIVMHMTKQYKNMEDNLNKQIQEDSDRVKAQNEEKRQLNMQIAQLAKEKEEMIIKKEEEIGTLKDRIEQITSNFAELLKQTLTKMQERIDEANQNFEGDQPNM